GPAVADGSDRHARRDGILCWQRSTRKSGPVCPTAEALAPHRHSLGKPLPSCRGVQTSASALSMGVATMSNVVVTTNLTLDGVMQAPGRPDEDLRGGFAHGGWATPYAAMMELFSATQTQGGESMANRGALLFGRRTYEDFATVWPNRTDNP